MTRQRTIEEFADYVDKALENWTQTGEGDVYDFAKEIAELIRLFHMKNKYLGISIEGYQGTGKTTLALLIAKEYYGEWEKAFSSIRFSLRDFIMESIEHVQSGNGNRIPLRILDDFAFQGGSKWKMERSLRDLLEYMNVIRTLYTSLIFTYVDDAGAKFIRDNAKLKLVLNMSSIDTVEVRVYSRRYTVVGVRWRKIATIAYNPGEIHSDPAFSELYREYWRTRLEAVEEKGKLLLEGLDSRKLRIHDVIMGYYLCREGYPLREIKHILRNIIGIEFMDNTFWKIRQLVENKLSEYNIIGGDRTANHIHRK